MSDRERSACTNKRNVTLRWLLIITLLLSMALLLNACQEEDPTPEAAQLPAEEATEVPPTEVPPEPTEVPPTDVPPTEVPPEPTAVPPEPTEEPPPPPDQSAIVAAWAGSPHGNTYDLGKGPNTYCSRCHSPQNWDPASTIGPPPNCNTCKFPHEEEMREAPTMAFVAEEDWIGITCETCHIMENEAATETIAWLNTRNNEYEPVNTPNEICEKCHLTSAGISWTGGTGVEHGINLSGSAHKNWAGLLDDERRPEYCSECHDPHTQQPTLCVDCHGEVLTLDTHIMGNNAAHENVACTACHDASGAEVGPHPDEEMGGMFTTVLSSIGRDGSPSLEPIVSHSVQWLVECDRCHFSENPWELFELTAGGQIPSEEDSAGGPPG